VAKFLKLRKRERAKKAKSASGAVHRQQVIARPHVVLERTEVERDEEAIADIKADLAGCWRGED
jgi:hypothetical protein